MSHSNQPITTSSTTLQQPGNHPAVPIPSFLENAGKVTKIVFGVLLGITAIGSLGIGITMTPFAPEIGASALAIAAALFGAAGYLIYSSTPSSSPDLSSRNISSF